MPFKPKPPRETIDEETQKILLRDEVKIIGAIDMYYFNFTGEGKGKTIHECCGRFKLNSIYFHEYRYFRKEYNLGMPSDREEAQEFLENLKKLKRDIGLEEVLN